MAKDKKFLKDTNDVVLDFPYKDCVLVGGQSTEESLDNYFEYDETITKAQEKQGLKAQSYNQKTAKRKEIFFNQTLAKDEIDRLYDPKALTNWKRFFKD
jgi:adenine-specific DNA-methyltransferase